MDEHKLNEYLGVRVTKLESLVDDLTNKVNKSETEIRVLKAKIAIGATLAGSVIAYIIQYFMNSLPVK